MEQQFRFEFIIINYIKPHSFITIYLKADLNSFLIMSQSSWKDQIKKKWGPHSHCPICGKAMPSDKQFCSQACRDNYMTSQRKQKRKGRYQMIFLFGIMGVMILFLFILG